MRNKQWFHCDESGHEIVVRVEAGEWERTNRITHVASDSCIQNTSEMPSSPNRFRTRSHIDNYGRAPLISVLDSQKMGARDKVMLRGLRFFGRHGVLKAEQELGQRFEVDLTIGTDLRKAGVTNNLRNTVDYSKVYGMVKEIVEGPPKLLIEGIAEEIAASVLYSEPLALDISVRVSKPHVALPGIFDLAAVEIYRQRSEY